MLIYYHLFLYIYFIFGTERHRMKDELFMLIDYHLWMEWHLMKAELSTSSISPHQWQAVLVIGQFLSHAWEQWLLWIEHFLSLANFCRMPPSTGYSELATWWQSSSLLYLHCFLIFFPCYLTKRKYNNYS